MSSFFCRILVCLIGYPALLAAQTSDTSVVPRSPLMNGRNQQAQAYLTQAKKYISEGQTAEAQHVLSQAIAVRHDLSEAYLLRAGLKRDAHDLAGAIVDYSVVVHQQPEHYEARFQRAITEYDAERFEVAREDFRYLLDHPRGETNTLYFKGDASSGEFVATAATTLQSDMKADLLNYLGLCYWNTADYEQAGEYFTQAITHRPDDPMAYTNLGLTYESAGDTLRAVDSYQQALLIAPDHALALRNLSSLARQLNDTTLERETISREHSYEALLQKGMYHHRQGEYDAAISAFTQALAQSSDQSEGLIQRGFAYEKALRPSEALEDYTRAIRLNPLAEKAYSNRGNIYFNQGEYTLALADYHQALKLDSENSAAWYNRGLTYYRSGDREAACRDLQKALALGNQAAAKPLDKICKQ